MINTLALISQKGGSGKTTLAIALAVAHETAGHRAAVVDLDPQESATAWGRLRDGASPPVVPAHAPRLARVVQTAGHAGASLVVIDTAPRDAGGVAEAARIADLVLIPCRPAAPDLMAVPTTLDTIGTARAVAVLNACPPRGSWKTQAGEALRGIGATVASVTFGARVAHPKAFVLGRSAQETEPSSPASQEIEALYGYCYGGTLMTKRTMADALEAAATPKGKKARKTIPSRRGKRAWLVYLDPDTARRLKAAAAMNDRSLQSFGVEAADLLLERYGMR